MKEKATRRGERKTSLGQILDVNCNFNKGKELGNMVN